MKRLSGKTTVITGGATTGAPAFSAYSASKAAVRNLARTWAEDLKGTGTPRRAGRRSGPAKRTS